MNDLYFILETSLNLGVRSGAFTFLFSVLILTCFKIVLALFK